MIHLDIEKELQTIENEMEKIYSSLDVAKSFGEYKSKMTLWLGRGR